MVVNLLKRFCGTYSFVVWVPFLGATILHVIDPWLTDDQFAHYGAGMLFTVLLVTVCDLIEWASRRKRSKRKVLNDAANDI